MYLMHSEFCEELVEGCDHLDGRISSGLGAEG